MTIEQIVDIPADHRIFLEFLAPTEIPEGPAWIELKVTPVTEKEGRSVPEKGSIDQATPRADRLLGTALQLSHAYSYVRFITHKSIPHKELSQ
jgi:hypothetical protein